jgi:thioester reductase-like protein
MLEVLSMVRTPVADIRPLLDGLLPSREGTPCVPDMPADAQPRHLVDLLQHRVRVQGDAAAYTFLDEGEREAGTLTWAGLDRRARALAVRLRESAAVGDRVLLLHPPGLEYLVGFFGCLMAGVVSVPAFPPRRGRHDARVAGMAADSGATLALCPRAMADGWSDLVADTAALAAITPLATDDDLAPGATDPAHLRPDAEARAARWVAPPLAPDTLAYLQYTSGSTSAPRGVEVGHHHLLYNLADLDAVWDHGPDSVMVTWLPVFHDMGLIYGLLMSLFRGFRCVFMAPEAFVQRPIRWLRALTHYRGTHCAAPSFAYDLCVRRIPPAQRADLDLSAWRMTLNAAEPVRADVMDRFVEAFAPCGFRRTTFTPGYGLAEATLKATAACAWDEPLVRWFATDALEQHRVEPACPHAAGARALVGNGSVAFQTRIAIVDPDTRRRCPGNRVGEVWLSGPSRAGGYRGLPEVSRETFEARLADDDGGPTEDTPWLRTGDLGFVHEGQLFITGRRKELIILRGANHYPQDIEHTAEQAHPALRPGCGAAFALPSLSGDLLALVHEVRPEAMAGVDPAEVVDAIRHAVSAEHALPVDGVALVAPGGVPKTSSGKKQRGRCRAEFLAGAPGALWVWRSAKVVPDPAPAPSPAQAAAPALDGAAEEAQVQELLEWLRTWAPSRLQSRVADERRTLAPHVVLDLGNRGLFGMQVPPALGGLGLGHHAMMQILTQLGGIDQSVALFVALNNVLGVRPLLRFASPEVQQRVLPALAAGRELTAFALSEPGAGSNPRALAGTAKPDDAGLLRVTATKWWIGVGSWATRIHTFVREHDAEGRPLGLSCLTVPQGSPGLHQGPEAPTMGMKGFIQNTIHYRDVPVDPTHRLGAPGQGMEVAEDAMMLGRLAIAAMSAGGLQRCAQLMVRWAARRAISTGLLLDHPLTLERIDRVVTDAHLVSTWVEVLSRALDGGRHVPAEAFGVAKMAGPECFWQATDDLMQLLGGRGYLESNPAAQMMRDARVLRIFEGPTETIAMHTGSRLWNRREDLPAFLAGELGASGHADDLRALASAIRDEVERGSVPADLPRRRHMAQGLLGELAAACALAAAAAWAVPAGAEASHPAQRAARAAEARWQAQQARCRDRLQGAGMVVEPAELADRVAAFTASIGDLDPLHVGTDEAMDAQLRRDGVPPLHNGAYGLGEVREDASVHMRGEAGPDEDVDVAASPLAATVEAWLLQWLERELQAPRSLLHAEAPFTRWGMDSVSALTLVTDLEDWLATTLSPDLLWSHPDPRRLAARLAQDLEGGASGSADPPVDDPWTQIAGDAHLPEDIRGGGAVGPWSEAPSQVLLTGATGYVGVHLLDTLLRRTGATVHCLVRASGPDEGMARLQAALARSGLTPPEVSTRVRAVPGDLAAPGLGLDADRWRALADGIDRIYHCGALVNFALPYAALRDANVGGTVEVLRLATSGRPKAVHAVSTFSLVGLHSATPQEDTAPAAARAGAPLLDGEAMSRRFLDLGYVQSKWVSDTLLLEAQARGVPVAVYRPASVGPHRGTGRWSEVDWVYRLVGTCARMQAAPEQDLALAMVPVDWVAETLVSLSLHPEAPGRGFNLSSSNPVPWSRVLDRLDAVQARRGGDAPVARMPAGAWLTRVRQEAREPDHPLAPLVPMLEKRPPERLLLGFGPDLAAPALLASVSLAGTGLACPPMDDAELDRLVEAALGERAEAAWAGPVAPAAVPASCLPALEPTGVPRRLQAVWHAWSREGRLSEATLARSLEDAPRAAVLWQALAALAPADGVGVEGMDEGGWARMWTMLAGEVARRGRGVPGLTRLTAALWAALHPGGGGPVPVEALRGWYRALGVEADEALLAGALLRTGGGVSFDLLEDALAQVLLGPDERAGLRLLFGRCPARST